MIVGILGSRYKVSMDEDYKVHVHTSQNRELREITDELTPENKEELLSDLVFSYIELAKEKRDLKEEIKRFKDGIEKAKAEIDNSRTISLTYNTALDECLDIINKHLGE